MADVTRIGDEGNKGKMILVSLFRDLICHQSDNISSRLFMCTSLLSKDRSENVLQFQDFCIEENFFFISVYGPQLSLFSVSRHYCLSNRYVSDLYACAAVICV